ncbi:TetR family transcriptional regulator [Tsukamurella sp. 8F]|uniref:TetR/AcrR family transcriptional regulator n=1 Tax=unclassified Tsukamurella TaxID=2633480 RepID=UPI0023BA2520|nr:MULTISPECIES: TetR family transcriptional regulator [unclassified Tsukamurella]MDF0528710.1 TetR family transcriptional regulator [Tsukamurella sp. 8J]MDF0585672.1 TetR family transcriptional regulator [Tsukamurella sp. 8F]
MPTSRERGRHAGLSRGAILDAAVALVDRDGLAALSMRRLGTALGVEAMALYHHFPSKGALLDGLVERLVGAVALPGEADEDWRDGLRRYAGSALETLAAHPNLVSLMLTRPGDTAANHEVMESLLLVLVHSGFEPGRALDLLYALNSLIVVNGALRAGGGPEPRGEEAQTGRLGALSPQDYPLLVEAARAGRDRGPTARFDAAVDALLVGFTPSAASLPPGPAR